MAISSALQVASLAAGRPGQQGRRSLGWVPDVGARRSMDRRYGGTKSPRSGPNGLAVAPGGGLRRDESRGVAGNQQFLIGRHDQRHGGLLSADAAAGVTAVPRVSGRFLGQAEEAQAAEDQ